MRQTKRKGAEFTESLFTVSFNQMKTSLQAPVISRIAPTPSGFLHEGNAFSFVLTWLLVRKFGGRLLLRIDDIDAARKRPEYVEDIFRTLEWLELDYDLGPEGPDDFEKNYSQHHRLGLYNLVLEELAEVPGLVYACKCSRKEVQLHSSNGLYPGTCREVSWPLNKKNCALRVHLPEEQEVTYFEFLKRQEVHLPIGVQMGDFIIRKKDGLPAYQLISLAEDMDYGVNLLVRGSDLRESTGAQLFLASCLEKRGEKFKKQARSFLGSQFLHHPLMLDQAGEKLSKSKGAASILEMRKSGGKPQRVYSRVASFAGLPEESYQKLEDLFQAFTIGGFSN